MDIQLKPIAFVISPRVTTEDDNWGSVESALVLDESLPDESLDGIEAFSHLEIIFHFHQVNKERIVAGSRHPRENRGWPKCGILAQRGSVRPNLLGSTIVQLIRRENRKLIVKGLDAVNGTPVVDIKPVLKEFLPKEPIEQPSWSTEIMKNYW